MLPFHIIHDCINFKSHFFRRWNSSFVGRDRIYQLRYWCRRVSVCVLKYPIVGLKNKCAYVTSYEQPTENPTLLRCNSKSNIHSETYEKQMKCNSVSNRVAVGVKSWNESDFYFIISRLGTMPLIPRNIPRPSLLFTKLIPFFSCQFACVWP